MINVNKQVITVSYKMLFLDADVMKNLDGSKFRETGIKSWYNMMRYIMLVQDVGFTGSIAMSCWCYLAVQNSQSANNRPFRQPIQ